MLSSPDSKEQATAGPTRFVYSSKPSSRVSREGPQPLKVIKYTTTTPESLSCAERELTVWRTTRRLIGEFRTLISSIRQRHNLQHQPVTKSRNLFRKILPALHSAPIRAPDDAFGIQNAVQQHKSPRDLRRNLGQLEQLYINLVFDLTRQVNLSDAKLYELQKEFKSVLDCNHNVYTRKKELTLNTSEIVVQGKKGMIQVMNFISFHTHLINLTNASAMAINHLHFLLRLRITAMIIERWHIRYLGSQFITLKEMLMRLHKDKKGKIVEHGPAYWEDRYEVLAKLKLGDTVQPCEQNIVLAATQFKEQHRTVDLHFGTKRTPLGTRAYLQHALSKKAIRFDHRPSKRISRIFRLCRGRRMVAIRIIKPRMLIKRLELRGKNIRMIEYQSLERKNRKRRRAFIQSLSKWLGIDYKKR